MAPARGRAPPLQRGTPTPERVSRQMGENRNTGRPPAVDGVVKWGLAVGLSFCDGELDPDPEYT